MEQIRRANLAKMIEESGMKQTRFSISIDYNAGMISQLLTGKKPFGERLARGIEEAADKPPLWLDIDHESGHIKVEEGPKAPIIEYNEIEAFLASELEDLDKRQQMPLWGLEKYPPRAFALLYNGGDELLGELSPGMYVALDPDEEPKNNKIVCFLLNSAPAFGIYQSLNNSIRYTSPHYSPMNMDNAKFVGSSILRAYIDRA